MIHNVYQNDQKPKAGPIVEGWVWKCDTESLIGIVARFIVPLITFNQRVSDATRVYKLSFYTLCFLSLVYHEWLQFDQKGCTGHFAGHLCTLVYDIRYSMTELLLQLF